MKKLMLGNEAFARGLYEAGCKVVSSYPGTPSTEITEEVAKYAEIYAEWAPNEKVAMENGFITPLGDKKIMDNGTGLSYGRYFNQYKTVDGYTITVKNNAFFHQEE